MVYNDLLKKRQRLLELSSKRRGKGESQAANKDEFYPFYAAIGAAICEARTRQQITQQDLAAVLGMQRTSIVNIEQGAQRLPLHKLYIIAMLLDIPAKDLLPDGLEEID